MGKNSQRRRQQRHRNRQRQEAGRPFGDAARGRRSAPDDVEVQVRTAVILLGSRRIDERGLRAAAARVWARTEGRHLRLGRVVEQLVLHHLGRAQAGGWGDHDLEQLVTRNAGERYLPVLRAARVGVVDVRDAAALQAALAVLTLLTLAPVYDVASLVGGEVAGTEPAHPKLAQVRALLAKAESTEFESEAEALTAKAQELISRYALESLVDAPTSSGAAGLAIRRLWLEPPYLTAKSHLVHHVSRANRCRSASVGQLGFAIVLGSPADLLAVEVLTTSLLVQADAVMLRHGRRADWQGKSRTRAFRHAFLLSFAVRVGQRLQEATSHVSESEDGCRLPALVEHEQHVDETFEALIPTTTSRRTAVDGEGWEAGYDAADGAVLGREEQVGRTLPALPGQRIS